MKNKYLMGMIALLVVVFMTACQTETEVGGALEGGTVPNGATQGIKDSTQGALTQIKKAEVGMTQQVQAFITQQTMEVTDPQIKQMMQSQELVNKVVAAGNLEGCSKFKDAYYKESCQVFILAGKAVSKSDTKVCEAGATAKIRDLCKVYVSQKQ